MKPVLRKAECMASKTATTREERIGRLYGGPAPGTVGLYQFNVVVPEAHGRAGVEFRLDGTPLVQRLVLALQP